jgi:hypothetical protein
MLLAVNDADNSLTFAGNGAEGATVRFLQSNLDRLVDGATEATQQIINKQLTLSNSGLAICVSCVSCVGRKLVIKEQISDEVYAIQRLLGSKTGITGFYSNGEICSGEDDSQSQLHNQTMTIAYLNEN